MSESRITTLGGLHPDDPAVFEIGPSGQYRDYLVLTEEERALEFLRPLRTSYTHTVCEALTQMVKEIAETFAREPGFYSTMYCRSCKAMVPVGELRWADGGTVGT